ncbi:MAG: sce7726 family protein [Pseudomonas sp.]|uniref:sce7726 family protein n=1 Tax=Stenotrophomonas sp. TaxID=69392 RepID=UPI003D6D766D
MNYAQDEILRIMQWLLPQLAADEILAVELAYKDVRRKADVAILSPSRLTAIEVKGPRDNLQKLHPQISDYLQGFQEVYVAAATRFIPQLSKEMPRQVGIIELASDAVKHRRKATRRACLPKDGAIHWLQTRDLQRLLGPASKGKAIEHLREHAVANLSSVQLSNAALKSVFDRAKARYDIFRSELGERLTHDDIETLQLPTKIR